MLNKKEAFLILRSSARTFAEFIEDEYGHEHKLVKSIDEALNSISVDDIKESDD